MRSGTERELFELYVMLGIGLDMLHVSLSKSTPRIPQFHVATNLPEKSWYPKKNAKKFNLPPRRLTPTSSGGTCNRGRGLPSTMKATGTALAALTLLHSLNPLVAFAPVAPVVSKSSPSRLFSAPPKQDKDTEEDVTKATSDADADNTAAEDTMSTPKDDDVEGLPWWWDLVWKLDIMKTGEPGEDVIFGDSANVLRTNIEQIYGGFPSLDGCPIAEGDISDIADGTMFIGLQRYYENYGSPYKLCFGPKSFLVVSDPIQARHILRDANTNYDKGVLAEILEPIMGKGLIPADPATWSVRRRQIVPGFHKVRL